MDRNSVIGLVLIGVILIGYSLYYQPDQEQLENMKRKRDSLEQVQAEKERQQRRQDSLRKAKLAEEAKKERVKKEEATKQEDVTAGQPADKSQASTNVTTLKDKYGTFYKAAEGEEKTITLSNDLLELTLSNRGGKPYKAKLKDYQRYDSSDVVLFEGPENEFGFNFYSQNRVFATNDLYFKVVKGSENIQVRDKPEEVVLRLYAEDDQYIEYIYTMKPGSYMVDFQVNMHNMNEVLPANTTFLDLKWSMNVLAQEKGKKWETRYSGVYYKFHEDEVENLSTNSDEDSEQITTKLKWISYKQQFFASVLMANNFMLSADVSYSNMEDSEKYIMRCNSEITFPYENQARTEVPLSFYFGPNKHQRLATHDQDLEELIPLGWAIFGWVNRFAIIPAFNFLGNYFANYGIIILLLTIAIKLVLFPLTYRSYLSTAKMRVLKPQIDELNKKYPKKEDSMKKQQETMALYRKAGVNPAGGCLPLLLQLPILIAMYRFFPASIELRQESFLWANDLSSYDSILSLPFEIPFYGDHVSLFTLLMALTLLATTHVNNTQMAGSGNQMPGMKTMMYFMPVMLLFIFNNYSSGLSYYLLISNVITLGQTFGMRRVVDEQKMLKKIEKNKKKPAKKSKFQERLEKAAKERGHQMPKK